MYFQGRLLSVFSVLFYSHSPNGKDRERNEADMCDEAKTFDILRNMSLVHPQLTELKKSSILGNQGQIFQSIFIPFTFEEKMKFQ